MTWYEKILSWDDEITAWLKQVERGTIIPEQGSHGKAIYKRGDK